MSLGGRRFWRRIIVCLGRSHIYKKGCIGSGAVSRTLNISDRWGHKIGWGPLIYLVGLSKSGEK